MGLRLFNSKTRKIEEFKPLKGKKVNMYSCGPTVYDYTHIGNFRSFVWSDLLRRYLKFKGFELHQVMNITDVDDKTIKRSQEEKVPLKEVTDKYSKDFFDDCTVLNIEKPETLCNATDHIKEMVALIEQLLEKDLAYQAEDGIYFKVSAFKDYGQLVELKGLEAGKSGRVKADEYDKENARDFVLWKFWDEQDGDVFWETSLGKGRPGWHIECSAMSMKYLGASFDVHTGGVDLKFPHHENEIAQSTGCTGKDFVKYWLHNEHLLVDGKKMSKKLGNYYTLRDVLKKCDNPIAIRYLLLSVHYRQQLNFTDEGLEAAEQAVKNLHEFLDRLTEMDGQEKHDVTLLIAQAENKFEEAMDNDLQISHALAALFELIHEVNKLGDLTKEDALKVSQFFCKIDSVLGVLRHEDVEIPVDVQQLVDDREDARHKKDFAKADELREKIQKLGFVLDDTLKGVRVKKA